MNNNTGNFKVQVLLESSKAKSVSGINFNNLARTKVNHFETSKIDSFDNNKTMIYFKTELYFDESQVKDVNDALNTLLASSNVKLIVGESVYKLRGSVDLNKYL